MLPLIIVFFVIADLILVAFILARARLNDMKVPIRRDLFASGAPGKIMAIWAHPDDEITSAGTLSALTSAGADLTLVYLTAGEAARDTGYSREELAKVRREEAKVLGAQELAASSLDAQFEQLDASDEAVELDARLAALKAGSGGPKAVTSGQ